MIQAFKQIRLSNTLVSVSGGQLLIGSDSAVLQSQTGTLATNTSLAATGQALYNDIVNFSGNLNATYSTTANLAATGSALYNDIINFSGNLNASYASVPNLASTGTALYNDIIGLSGQAATSYSTIGNLTQTGISLSASIATQSGFSASTYLAISSQQHFNTAIASGNDTYYISFPSSFTSIPKIYATVEVTGNIMYAFNVIGKTVAGYTGIFSDTVQENGVSIDTLAMI